MSGFPLVNGTMHLYDMVTDSTEHNDVIADHPDVANTLLSEILAVEATGAISASNDPSCGPVTHPSVPGVGPVWEPWC